MSEPVRLPSTRYRSRILGAGLIAAGALYSFGAPLYVGRIEDDLAHRVPDELADAGFQGISAEFDGQDGTLRCSRPLDDPEGANQAAYGVWGVRAITLDRTCRVNTATEAESALQSAAAAPGSSDTGSSDAGSTDAGSTDAGSTIGAAYVTVVDLMRNDPRLAYFSMLLDESGLAATLGDEPVTVFAPTDDAFELLPADAIAGLRADPEVLAHVLGQHVALGSLASTDLRSGPLTMADGSTLDVVVDGDTITIGAATITEADLTAANGVVHVVDRVLIPDDVDVSQLEASS